MAMRTRTLKPGFFKNEDLARCDPLARILFSALWCLADRDGRTEDRPERIKAEALPYDNCNVDSLLQQLADGGFIKRYESQGKRCIAIPTFQEHQHPHPKEATAKLPSPESSKKRPGITRKAKKNPGKVGSSLCLPLPMSSSSNPSSSGTPSESPIAAAEPPRADRSRDELFDAIVEVTGADPKANGSHIGGVKKTLLAFEPPMTPEEVRRFPAVLAAQGWNVAPSLGVLQKHASWIRTPPAKAQPPPKQAPRMAFEGLKEFVSEGEHGQ
jgi:hypothetical protein